VTLVDRVKKLTERELPVLIAGRGNSRVVLVVGLVRIVKLDRTVQLKVQSVLNAVLDPSNKLQDLVPAFNVQAESTPMLKERPNVLNVELGT